MEANQRHEVRIQFGKHLAALRTQKGLSLRDLASRCDVDYSDINKYERGEKDLQLTTIVDLAIGLGVSPSVLMDFDIDFLLS